MGKEQLHHLNSFDWLSSLFTISTETAQAGNSAIDRPASWLGVCLGPILPYFQWAVSVQTTPNQYLLDSPPREDDATWASLLSYRDPKHLQADHGPHLQWSRARTLDSWYWKPGSLHGNLSGSKRRGQSLPVADCTFLTNCLMTAELPGGAFKSASLWHFPC